MPSRIETIGKAIAADLDATFAGFTASFAYELDAELKETSQPTVRVLPATVEFVLETAARRRTVRNIGYLVVVQRKLAAEATDQDIHDALQTAQDIWEHLEPTEDSEAPSYSGADWFGTEHVDGVILDSDDLRDRRLVTIGAIFTYQDAR